MAEDEEPESEKEGETKSTASRYVYTNDLISGGLYLLLVGLNVAFILLTNEVPLWLAVLDTFAVSTAVVWTFGGKAASKAADFVSQGGK